MKQGILNYEQLVEDALRGVVRQALREVAEQGLPGDHHFYITFDTRFPGVRIPKHLLARYPSEITIVLQHQFWGLEIEDEAFEVSLSFNQVNERLRVPFKAIIGFTDPSVKFGIPFRGLGETAAAPRDARVDAEAEAKAALPDKSVAPAAGEVITLDAFRKK